MLFWRGANRNLRGVGSFNAPFTRPIFPIITLSGVGLLRQWQLIDEVAPYSGTGQ
jgi:hypothetical protein